MGNRSARAALATETDQIVARGTYDVSSSQVHIESAVQAAIAGTHHHTPQDAALDRWPRRDGVGKLVVTGESTLAATRRLAAERSDEVACLGFASPKQPGGDYRKGADAQEESLARSSALAACLRTVPAFYEQHQGRADPLYSDDVICSPGVPVFRDEGGALLADPYRITVLTCAAPNAAALVMKCWRGDIEAVLRQRAGRVLAAAAVHGHERLVLGAWGCGGMHNHAPMVADVFVSLLEGDFAGCFDLVTFAVTDVVPSLPTRRAFEERLGRAA